MDWKEFFKPNKWKIIISILLLFPISSTTCVSIPPEGCLTRYGPIILFPLINGFSPYGIRFPFFENILSNFGILLIGIILSYTISCTIVAIYNKIRK